MSKPVDEFYLDPMFTSAGAAPKVEVASASAEMPPSTGRALKDVRDFNWSRDYRGNLKWLPERTFFLTVHGSHAYGTSLPESDVDIRGIAVAPRSYYTSFIKNFEQSESKDPDLVIFEIRKFFQLASVANPNALEILFTRDQDHIHVTTAAKKLLENRDLFLSRRAKHTLSGYAMSQMRRINGHYKWLKDPPKGPPTRAEYGLPERTVIPADQLAAARAAVQKQLDRWAFKDMEDLTPPTRLRIMDGFENALAEMTAWAWHEAGDKKFQAAANVLGYSTNFIELLDIERKYEGAKRNWISYLKWQKERNPSRAALEEKYGYDCYADDTEFLTEGGWKKFDDVKKGDRLATVFVNWSDDAMGRRRQFGVEYQAFTERFGGYFTGNLFHFEGNHLDTLVTPNHRMLVRAKERASGKTGEWALSEAAFMPDTFEVVRTIEPKTKTYGTSSAFDGLPIGGDAYLRLMGWYLSDGSMAFKAAARGKKKGLTGRKRVRGLAKRRSRRPKDIRISQKKGGRLHKSMIAYARCHGEHASLYEYEREPTSFRPYKITEAVLSVRHPAVVERMYKDCGSTTAKRIPRWVFTLSKRHMEILFDAMADGDGTVRDTSIKSAIYYTILPGLAGDVQELAFLCGWETSVYGPYENGMMHVHVYKEATREKTLIRSANVRRVPAKNQRIVCFSVPNSTLVTRRNGHVAVHGNCKHGMHLVRLMWTARDLFLTGKYNVYRDDREALLSIRQGHWTYEQLVEFAEKMDKELTLLMEKSPLPWAADTEKLDALFAEIVEMML